MADDFITQDGIATHFCTRCGACCKKGGPALHTTDAPLIQSGSIPAKFLFTLRQGERVFDNIKACLYPAETDIIKIKSALRSSTCMFFEEKNASCGIYENRPLECRVLKCWDTRAIMACYSENRLTRKDLIGSVTGLWDMVEDHQKTCAYPPVLEFVEALKTSKEKNIQKEKIIGDTMAYDLSMRSVMVEKGGIDPEMLDFLFGRPLSAVLESLGFFSVQENGKRIFRPIPP
jgi:Fe-S-cluster containining protein